MYSNWLGIENLNLDKCDLEYLNFRLKKLHRIFKDSYEYGLKPTEQSIKILERDYKKWCRYVSLYKPRGGGLSARSKKIKSVDKSRVTENEKIINFNKIILNQKSKNQKLVMWSVGT